MNLFVAGILVGIAITMLVLFLAVCLCAAAAMTPGRSIEP